MTATEVPSDATTTDATDFSRFALLRVPSSNVVWSRAAILVSVVVGFYLLDRLALLFMDFWLLESLGFESVFWTNFWTGAVLFIASLILTTAAVALPAFMFGLSREARRRALGLGLLVGIVDDVVIGAVLSSRFRDFLLFANAQTFGETDPVFGHDLGFYVFRLPAMWTTWRFLMYVLILAIISSVIMAWIAYGRTPRRAEAGRVLHAIGVVATPWTRELFAGLGLVLATGIFLGRYDLLFQDNSSSSVYIGADALDVSGFFSSLNSTYVEMVVVLAATGLLWWKLGQLHQAVVQEVDHEEGRRTDWRLVGTRAFAMILVPGLLLDFGFKGVVALRDQVAITPNEPVVQLPFIERHIEATRAAWGLDEVEQVEFVPNGPDDPAPAVEDLLASPTLQNVPLWPGFVSFLERLLDPQHVDRIFLTGGDSMVYGPTLDILRQQQKLRPYYNFLDVDTVRYRMDDEPHLFASAVRELPLVEPQPWLAWWGQQFVLFTHGFGLAMARLADFDPATGEPVLASKDIPTEVTSEELAIGNERIYYGEGSGSMAYSNVRDVDEFDFPTAQGRAETRYPEDIQAGVHMDSLLKRLVFGYKSRQFLDILFSDLITSESRVHYFRTPLERLEHIAPFLYLDTDPYAVKANDRVTWMVNAMTVTDRYPYSMMVEFGDKSVRRSPTPRAFEWVNYAADSVKATVDAYTGEVTLYRISDEPIARAWAEIYPDLFVDGDEMPEDIQDQRQYPPQLFHAQFDDLYIFYQMTDPIEFFNLEDLWDDADEVLGPIVQAGDGITFSIEPYYWIARTGRDLPESAGPPTQFAMSLAFTPENATNLRSIVTAYQERGDYGRLISLQVPKGEFFPGPEQADSAIDQDTGLGAQFSLWNRQGSEVLRGHTTPLIVDGEVIYVEPVFIRSAQNPTPQLKLVVVVWRGSVGEGPTLEHALRVAMERGPNLEFFEPVEAEGGPPAGQGPGGDEVEEEEDGGPPPGRGPGSGDG